MTEINIEASAPITITVNLVGTKYEVTPPKVALAMRLAIESKLYQDDPSKMISVVDAWIEKAFGKKPAASIQKRLDDAEDALDFTHIMDLMEKVIEVQMEGDPTT